MAMEKLCKRNRMKTRNLIYLLLVLLNSCFRVPEEKIVGLYISKNTLNTTDSLLIKKDNTYSNSIYRKLDNSLIYINKGKWKYKDGYVILENFFEDGDQNYSKDEFYFENVLIDTQLPLEWNGDKIIIHYLA